MGRDLKWPVTAAFAAACALAWYRRARKRARDTRFSTTYADIERAAAVHSKQGLVQETPIFTSRSLEDELSARVGRRVALHWKGEHLQTTGSFKIRGAAYACGVVDAPTVVTHSSGNAGAALAFAATALGKAATVVCPRNAPSAKVRAIERSGGRVVPCEPTQEAREQAAAREAATAGGAPVISAFDDPLIIAGQGTLGREWVKQRPETSAFVIPISGGGLISGCAIAMCASATPPLVFGVEPAACPRAALSRAQADRVAVPPPTTVCDALRIQRLGEHTWPVVRDLVAQCFEVSDADVVSHMHLIYERLKQVVEPSGAVATAGVFSEKFIAMLKAKPEITSVGILLCGGNVDLKKPLPFSEGVSEVRV